MHYLFPPHVNSLTHSQDSLFLGRMLKKRWLVVTVVQQFESTKMDSILLLNFLQARKEGTTQLKTIKMTYMQPTRQGDDVQITSCI